jgi:hypothetical protein
MCSRYHLAMISKTDQIKAAWAGGDKIGALRIASRFFDRSPETATMKRGWEAHSNPTFYRQIGKDPEAMTEAALNVLACKFGLN